MNNKPIYLPLAFLLAFSLIGCGNDGMTKVSGKVTFGDGAPVTRGTVYFDSGTYAASGPIQPDGTYVLGSLRPGDGAPAGEYVVILVKEWEDPVDEDGNTINTFEVHPRYTNRETSGLTFTIEPGRPQVFNIVVERTHPLLR